MAGTKKRVPLESKVEGWLRNEVVKRGGLYYKFTSPGNVGVPDRIILYNGKTFFVELKKDDGKLSRIQEVQLDRMRRAGAKVEVVYGRKGAAKLLSKIFSTLVEAPSTLKGFGIEEWTDEKENWSDRA